MQERARRIIVLTRKAWQPAQAKTAGLREAGLGTKGLSPRPVASAGLWAAKRESSRHADS